MTLRPHHLLLAALACLAAPSYADDGQTQVTISVYNGSKPVAGLIFPIGAKVNLSAAANHVDSSENKIRFTGNVQGRFTPPAEQAIVLFGEEVVLSREAISAERAKAVRDIEAMAGPDQLYRGRSETGDLSPEEWKQQTAIDVANMKRLAEIIDAYGWPGLRFAGAASQTAFLVLQHADHASQRKYLPQLHDAVQRHDALGSALALLEDRLLVADGKPQRYGSQLSTNPLRFDPIEDEARVDERRRSIGLEPLADYAKRFGLSYAPEKAKESGVAHQKLATDAD
ncbi:MULTISPECIES: DUF6624 domain-containing protein [unclassified Janthinobacterium]|uniref:DUF6624 domain-containing protein n=1 Tax=unclassified Janthinobacterium TaxID=2610881 RepID=UPI001607AB6B|nr:MULTISPECIES: DUF6624 domain-containing protein [unclassified Janthinobacterium]MBB5610645.1 hypothetical protein [Janthinobacterium sp. S3T4]MBB5616131.1 hypothetical protein [Janthinobacterium sp. S3M3]